MLSLLFAFPQKCVEQWLEICNPVNTLRVYIFDLRHATQALSINMNSSGDVMGEKLMPRLIETCSLIV